MHSESTEQTFAPVPRFLYGTAWKEARTRACVERALEAGFRGIDTANQRVHYHEAGVGEALQAAYDTGRLTRGEVFLQSKFTPRAGQDHRLPYDADAPLATQVRQSFESSLAHLRTDRLDACLLHGPYHPSRVSASDWEVWAAFEELCEAGRVRYLGVSNVTLDQLRGFCARARIAPDFVQNRCFAHTQWDKPVREYCRANGITYQGFSLLTANVPVLRDRHFAEIVTRTGLTPAQVVFAFALQVGMLPLTGTSDPRHMDEDLAALDVLLGEDDLVSIETMAAPGG